MQLKDNEQASFGAEALPGGLREINAQRHGEAPAPARTIAPAQPAPLVGLIALARHWLGRHRR